MSGWPWKTQRNLRSRASFSSEVPGSVMAANCSPGFLDTLETSSQKCANWESVSVVPPDLLATMKRVAGRSMLFVTAATVAGSVVSSTCSRGMPGDLAEGVEEHVWPEAGAAHPEQDGVRVGLAGPCQVAQLGLLRLHLLDHVQPAQPLGRVAFPEGSVLGPEPARRVGLLKVRGRLVDDRLERAERVPLGGALAGTDLARRLGQRAGQVLVGLEEGVDALDLQLPRHLVEVDADLGQLLQLPLGDVDVLVERAADLAVLAEGRQRVGRDRVDGVRPDQLLDVHRVGVARVLDRGARPEAALGRGARLPERLPAGTAVELLELLVGHLGVGDAGLAVEPLQLLGLLRDPWRPRSSRSAACRSWCRPG